MSLIKQNITNRKLAVKKNTKICIVKSRYNSAITNALLSSTKGELKKAGVSEKNIIITEVPGAYELPFGCQSIIKKIKPDAVIALGAIIKGQTPHFDFIASSVAQGIMEVGLKMDTPTIFGVLTTNNMSQTKDRIKNGKRGDKGKEAAQTALEMINNS